MNYIWQLSGMHWNGNAGLCGFQSFDLPQKPKLDEPIGIAEPATAG